MRSPFNFLVRPLEGKRYDNTRKAGDKEFLITTSFEDATTTQRHAEVIATPIGYTGPVKDGDTVIVHHNVFRKLISLSGKEVSTAGHFKDDMFLVMPEHVYLYNRGEGWNAVDDFCFIKPVDNDDDFYTEKFKQCWGEVVYPSEAMVAIGINKGDTVSYQPESEYEFTIDGEMLYRMFTRNVCLKK